MANSDSPRDAARNCMASGVPGTCCMYHLYGVGAWYLTNGVKASTGRVCETEANGNKNSCLLGTKCKMSTCKVPAWISPATSCDGTVVASGSMEGSDDPAEAGRPGSLQGLEARYRSRALTLEPHAGAAFRDRTRLNALPSFPAALTSPAYDLPPWCR